MSRFDRYLDLTNPGDIMTRKIDGMRFIRMWPSSRHKVTELHVFSMEDASIYHMDELLNVDDDFLDLFDIET